MDEKLKYILNEEKRRKRKKEKNNTLNSYSNKKMTRYDSAVFYMQNKKIIGLKEQLPIKNLEFESPNSFLSPQKFQRKNVSKYKTKLLHLNKPNIPLNQNQVVKNIFIFNKIKSKNVLIKNKILRPFIATIHNNLNDIEKRKFPNSFSSSYIKNQKIFQLNCLNKNSQTEKPEIIKIEERKKKEINSQLEPKNLLLKDRVPINTLKYFHPKLFRHKLKFQRRKIESNNDQDIEKTSNRNEKNFSESGGTSQINDNITVKYEMMEFNNKKNYVASQIKKRKNNSPLYKLRNEEKTDFHYIMKHPFSNNYFCSSFINHLTYYNNNSYINDYSEQFQNLANPLKDVDLIRKLHNLIINPNTNKIRNTELLLMYRNFPKGTFYGNKNNTNNYIIDKELKKLEKTKFGKFVMKLNETMQKAKEIQKELDLELLMNKNKL